MKLNSWFENEKGLPKKTKSETNLFFKLSFSVLIHHLNIFNAYGKSFLLERSLRGYFKTDNLVLLIF